MQASYTCFPLGAPSLTPADIFRQNIPDLSENIGKSFNFDRVVNRLHSDGLLTESFVSDVTSKPLSDYQRGSSVVRELYRQLQSCLTKDPRVLLLRICEALMRQENQTLQGLGRDMKHQLTNDDMTDTIEDQSKLIPKSIYS